MCVTNARFIVSYFCFLCHDTFFFLIHNEIHAFLHTVEACHTSMCQSKLQSLKRYLIIIGLMDVCRILILKVINLKMC